MVIFNNNGMLRGVFFFYASSCVFQSWPLIPTILVIVQGFFGMSPKYPVGSLLLLMRDKKKNKTCIDRQGRVRYRENKSRKKVPDKGTSRLPVKPSGLVGPLLWF